TSAAVTDGEALEGFQLLSRLEGIIPALESAHAVSWVAAQRGTWRTDDSVLICISGRGDKDVAQVSELLTTASCPRRPRPCRLEIPMPATPRFHRPQSKSCSGSS